MCASYRSLRSSPAPCSCASSCALPGPTRRSRSREHLVSSRRRLSELSRALRLVEPWLYVLRSSSPRSHSSSSSSIWAVPRASARRLLPRRQRPRRRRGAGLFGMAQTISDERYTQTLALLVVSPANRVATVPRTRPARVANGSSSPSGYSCRRARLPHPPTDRRVTCAGAHDRRHRHCLRRARGSECALGLRWRETAVLRTPCSMSCSSSPASTSLRPAARLDVQVRSGPTGHARSKGCSRARHRRTVQHGRGLIAAEALVGAAVHVARAIDRTAGSKLEARRGAALEVA